MFASSLSRKILIASIILMILAFIRVATEIYTATVLVPTLVWPELQLWRIVAYPLAYSWFGIAMAIITFSVPSEELESMIGTRQLALLLVVVTLFVGVMHTVLFFNGDRPLYGPANMSFFVMFGYVYLYPQSEVQLIFFRIKSWVLMALFVAVLFGITISNAVGIGDLIAILPNGGFGVLMAGIYFHTRFQKYPFLLKPIRSMERMAGMARIAPPARKPMPVQRRVATQQPVRVRIPFQKQQAQREMSDEERLNMILEKINEKSIDALSEEEKKFLRDYSGRL